MSKKKLLNNNGFTLIEMSLAVFLLGLALVTIIGLQSSVLQRSITDNKRLQALTIARIIMSQIETARDEVSVETRSGTVQDFITESQEIGLDPQKFNDFSVKLEVTYAGIPAKPDALKKINLSVYWNDIENYSLVYFIPNDQNEFEE